MNSERLLQILIARNHLGENFFHELCQANSIALLRPVAKFLDEPITTILNTKNYNGELCTHIIVKCKAHYAVNMMELVVHLGADINGKEGHGGFTPLHLCVWEKNYHVAEWLCGTLDADIEATNYAGETAYQLAYQKDDHDMMEIIRKSRAKCKASFKKSSPSSDDESQDLSNC